MKCGFEVVNNDHCWNVDHCYVCGVRKEQEMTNYNERLDEPNLDEQIRIVLKNYDQFITTKQAISDIKALIANQVREARINELRAIEPPEQYKYYARISGHDACAVCGFNAIKFGEFIEDRIAQLRSTK